MMTVSIAEPSSVEALAFNYLRFGLLVVANNFWTLVAVATAAVSFWRFKLAPSLARHHFRIPSALDVPPESPSSIPRQEQSAESTSVTPQAPTLETEGYDDGGLVTGKRVYSRFYYDDVMDGQEEEEPVEEEVEELVAHGDETMRFDVSERMRWLDLGFYEHQDLRVLDGNVVRLWDSCRVSLSPRATERAALDDKCGLIRLGALRRTIIR
uniref:Uncharacterized protein n=1 Tax=Kalanchoe fedtschenkoi TaxID=63787 RepID=A0A7N0V9S9_KALFE